MSTALEATRERLLIAAGKTFAEKGFRGATVREICRRARVNVAAVNYYFGDKQRLYIESVKRAHRLRVQQVPLPAWPPGFTAEQKLRGFIRTLLVRMVGDFGPAWHMQLMMRELFQPTEAVAELVRDFIRPQFAVLLEILSDLLPPGVSEKRKHLIAFSIIGQCLHYRVAKPLISLLVGDEEEAEIYELNRLADHIADFTLSALKSDSWRDWEEGAA